MLLLDVAGNSRDNCRRLPRTPGVVHYCVCQNHGTKPNRNPNPSYMDVRATLVVTWQFPQKVPWQLPQTSVGVVATTGFATDRTPVNAGAMAADYHGPPW